MGEISFSNHISNKKSAINSKAKLAGVAKHNLRKYRLQDYSRDNTTLLYGTANLMQDVKNVYRKEFDVALHEYNAKQTRPERRSRNICRILRLPMRCFTLMRQVRTCTL